MKINFRVIILGCLCFCVACNQHNEKPAITPYSPEKITGTFMVFWSYWNREIKLNEPFVCLDSNDHEMAKAETLDSLATGRYLPVKIPQPDSSAVFELARMPSTADTNIAATIQQMAFIEKKHFELEGKLLPAFDFVDLHGNKINRSFCDNNFILIKIWFIKCAPCERQRPEYEALMDKYSSRNVRFVTLADDPRQALREFVASRDIDFVVIPEQANYIRDTLGLMLYPTYILTDTKGMVIKVSNDLGQMHRLLIEQESVMVTVPAPPAG